MLHAPDVLRIRGKNMRMIIDRIEDTTAVVELETGETLCLPYALFQPVGAQEGDVLYLSLDKEQTALRKERSSALLKKLFEK